MGPSARMTPLRGGSLPTAPAPMRYSEPADQADEDASRHRHKDGHRVRDGHNGTWLSAARLEELYEDETLPTSLRHLALRALLERYL